jgi:hypothetical protein
LSVAQGFGVADGANEGACDTTAVEADGATEAAGEVLAPAVEHAAARSAMRPRPVMVVLRMVSDSSGWGSRESVPDGSGKGRRECPDVPKRRREEARRRFGGGT